MASEYRLLFLLCPFTKSFFFYHNDKQPFKNITIICKLRVFSFFSQIFYEWNIEVTMTHEHFHFYLFIVCGGTLCLLKYGSCNFENLSLPLYMKSKVVVFF